MLLKDADINCKRASSAAPGAGSVWERSGNGNECIRCADFLLSTLNLRNKGFPLRRG